MFLLCEPFVIVLKIFRPRPLAQALIELGVGDPRHSIDGDALPKPVRPWQGVQ